MGRFDCEVELSLLNVMECVEIFKFYVKLILFVDDVVLDIVVFDSKGYSGVDIVVFCCEVVMCVI